MDGLTLANWVMAISTVLAAVVAAWSARVAVRSNHRSNLFRDAQWVIESAWDPTGQHLAAFELRNIGESSAKSVRAVCPWDTTGVIVRPSSWDLIPARGGNALIKTTRESLSWLGLMSDEPARRVIEVSWYTLANDRRSEEVALPGSHHPPPAQRPPAYEDVTPDQER